MTTQTRARWHWTRWPLARQLPLITAAIIVLVMVLSLSLTYRALVEARADVLSSRLKGLMSVLVQGAEANTRARVALLHQVGTDTTLSGAVTAPAGSLSPKHDSAVAAVLTKVSVPADSGLPVELWTADGRRVAHIGQDIRGDSVAALPPELRSRRGTRVGEVPAAAGMDTAVQSGALYPSGGRVYYWVVAPVLVHGRRVGSIVQQRHIVNNPQTKQMIRDLSGEEITVYLRNATDGFWASLDGRPELPPVSRDTTAAGFIASRVTGEPQVGAEQHVRGSQYIVVLEAPKSTVVSGPRATLRRLAAFSLLLLVGGVAATWALSRRITRPLVELTKATEAMAQGEYGRRVEGGGAGADEVRRLGASFNRMASEVQASQQELASQVEEALDANRAKSDFLAVMSHELRTPLNAIGGYTEILQLGIYGQVNEAQQDSLGRIARSQQTLLSLINDVLNFAKLEAGEVSYVIADIPLVTMLTTIEEFVSPQLRDRKLAYALHPFDTSVTVRADADKLQQILINLLSNAVKYTPEGGRIDVRCEIVAHRVCVHVADTGIGIADDRVEKIFDPFIQVGRALNRPHEGVGLGLSISRDLATAMGGVLSVASVLGEGSTFTLALDRGTDAPPPA